MMTKTSLNQCIKSMYDQVEAALIRFTPLFALLMRLQIVHDFWLSGWNKWQSWDSTLYLFQYEFHLYLLPPFYAAVFSTMAELVLPAFLLLGLFGRASAFLLFVTNAVAVLSYPFLWTPEGAAGFQQHVNWGLMLGMLMSHGPGTFSVDTFIRKNLN